MVAVRLTPPFPFVVVGSPDYLRRRKRPERIDDLRDHACLRMRRSNGSIAPWPFVDGNKAVEAIVSGPLIAHDYPTLLGAAIQGVGLAQLPGPLARAPIADGRLQALLTPFAVTTPGVFLYYPGRRQVLPKLRAFIEHVKYPTANAPRDGTIARSLRKIDGANRLLRTVIRPDQRLSTTFRRPCGSSRPERIEIAGVSRSASAPSRQASPDATSRSTRPAAFSRQGWKSPLRAAPRASIPPRTLDRRPRSGPLEMGA